jgi:hypothetical protein
VAVFAPRAVHERVGRVGGEGEQGRCARYIAARHDRSLVEARERRGSTLSAVTFVGSPDPPSVEPLRRLIAETIERELELPHDVDRGDRRSLWQEAVRALVSLQGGWEADAEDAIASLVNHVRRLSLSAKWFLSEPELRILALEETMVHTAHRYEVTSQAAQDAWASYWSASMHRTAPPELMDKLSEAVEMADWLKLYASTMPRERLESLEQAWITAWNTWADRGGT